MTRYMSENQYKRFQQWREQRNLDAAGQGPQAPADPVWQSVARNVGTGPAPVLPPAPQPTPMPPPQLSVSDAWTQPQSPAIAPSTPVPSSMTVPSAWLAPYNEPAPLRLPKVPAFSTPTPMPPPDGMNWQTADQLAAPPTPTIPMPTRPYRSEAVDADLDALAAVPRDLAGAGLGAYNEFIGRPVTGLATELTGGREQEAYERQRGLPERADTGGDLGNWWRALSERQRARSEAGIANVPLGDVLPFTPGEYAGIARGVAPVARGLLGEVGAVAKSAPVAKGLQAVDRLATSPIVGKIAPGLGIEDVSKAAPDAPAFYSQLERAVASPKAPNRAPAEQWRGILNAQGVKSDELRWTGVDDLLSERAGRPVTRTELQDALNQNRVNVQEVTKGGPPVVDWQPTSDGGLFAREHGLSIEPLANGLYRFSDRSSGLSTTVGTLDEAKAMGQSMAERTAEANPSTKFSQYQLPGGESYRELLMTLPERERPINFETWITKERQGGKIPYGTTEDAERFRPVYDGLLARNRLPKVAGREMNYQSSHWSEPNVLAHIRFNDRTASDGKKVLFIEEVQSDWHQAGRQKGYAGGLTPDDVQITSEDARQWVVEIKGEPGHYVGISINEASSPMEAIQKAIPYLNNNWRAAGRGGRVPQAPFAKTWPELALKRMIRWASENGYDRIAWTTGKQQAERYDLAKQVEVIESFAFPDGTYKVRALRNAQPLLEQSNLTPEQLSETVGKDLANKIIEAPKGARKWEGVDLQVGGEGMQGFYDRILPETANKLGKKFGARVSTSGITTSKPRYELVRGANGSWVVKSGRDESAYFSRSFVDKPQAEQFLSKISAERPPDLTTVHSLDLSPALKTAAMKEGFPLFVPPEIGGAVAGGAYGAAQPAESEQERAQNIIKGAAGGALVGSGARAAGKALASRGTKGPFGERLGIADDVGKAVPEGAPKKKLPPEIEQPIQQGAQQELQGQQGAPPRPSISVEGITKSANAANRTLGEMYAKPTGSAAPGIIERMENVRRAIVRAATDEGVDLAKFQQQAAKAKGAPLSADEMAYELKRLNPDKAAQVALDEKLRPVVQGIGQDQPWLSVYLTHQDNIDVAKAMGNQARKFSGGLSVADSRQALQDMATELGPERFQAVQQAAQQVQDFGRQLLARKRDAGLITDQLYKDLTDMYPHYVPTRITDYMKDPMNIPVGKSLSVRDTGLRRNTVEGTIRAREDPLASMVRNAYETESIARKNEAFNAFVKLSQMDPELQAMVRKVPDSYTTTRAEAKVTGFVNGVRETYVVPKALEYVIRSEAKALIPGFAGDIVGAVMSTFRALATSRNPVFLAGNATLDAATYGIRESSRAGGPQALPNLVVELAKAYGDAFRGVLSGTYHGDTAEFLKAGGGQFGFFQGTPGKARATLQDLKRANVFTVNGLGDIGRLTKDLLTLKPVEGLGERIELAPRVASYRLAQKAGKNATQAVINGRTVTMDFSQGGSVSKVINQFVPFFNVGMQAFPQVVRAAGENPKGFIATTAALLAGPTIAAEAWNRSDPQRAQDYEDVPQYLKDQGVIVMLPGEAPTDSQGNRKPQFVQIRLREFAPFAIVTREAASRVMGDQPREWASLIGGIVAAELPISTNNPADALSNFMPLGFNTAQQLALNKDFFRNRMIVTKSGNERASTIGKAIGGALELPPAAVDFTVRDLASGVGGTALAAGDLVAGKAPRSSAPQDMPVAGGVYGRFVRGNTGDRLDKARQNLLTPEAKGILKAAGVDLPLQPVGYTINNVPLMMNEEEKYQVLTNRYIDEAIRAAAKLPRWGEYSADLRTKAIQSLVSGARERAGAEVLKGIGAEEMKRRLLAVKK